MRPEGNGSRREVCVLLIARQVILCSTGVICLTIFLCGYNKQHNPFRRKLNSLRTERRTEPCRHFFFLSEFSFFNRIMYCIDLSERYLKKKLPRSKSTASFHSRFKFVFRSPLFLTLCMYFSRFYLGKIGILIRNEAKLFG